MLSNEKLIKEHCEAMNAGTAYTLLAAMISRKSWEDLVGKGTDITR